jgi:hypothetical protein
MSGILALVVFLPADPIGRLAPENTLKNATNVKIKANFYDKRAHNLN